MVTATPAMILAGARALHQAVAGRSRRARPWDDDHLPEHQRMPATLRAAYLAESAACLAAAELVEHATVKLCPGGLPCDVTQGCPYDQAACAAAIKLGLPWSKGERR